MAEQREPRSAKKNWATAKQVLTLTKNANSAKKEYSSIVDQALNEYEADQEDAANSPRKTNKTETKQD